MEKWVQTVDYKAKRDDIVLNIGDYIDYHDQAGEDGTDLYEGKWQVLGADDDGNLLIISEENVTRHYFNEVETLKGGMKVYSNGVYTLNKICEVYGRGNGAVYARSIRVEDVDRLTGYNKIKDSNYGKSYTFENKKEDTFIWHDGIKWHETKSAKNVTLTNTYYEYTIKVGDLPLNVYDMLFTKFYWFASSFVYANSDYAYFGLRCVLGGRVDGGGFVYLDGDYYSGVSGVRAVVTLKSDINITPKVVTEWKF